MRIDFDPESHTYQIDGECVPCVSDILRPMTVLTYGEIDKFTLQKAQERGTRVHELCELLDYDALDDGEIEPDLLPYVSAYKTFKRDYRIREWKACERIVGCPELELAGTLDREGEIDGRLCILDIKTSSAVNKLTLTAQLTAYGKILHSYHDLYGLQLKKDGTYRLIKVEPNERLFYCLLGLWQEMNRGTK
jgi:hypothetical protein